MLKIYIRAVESKEDGTAVELFDDVVLGYDDKDEMLHKDNVTQHVFDRIERAEKINEEFAKPI